MPSKLQKESGGLKEQLIIILLIIKVFIQGFKQILKLTRSIINEDTTV